jgi:sugar/nucleoside kinase (ribokinase family)
MTAPNAGAGRVTVVGSLNMDLVVRAPRLPLPGETLAGRAYAQAAGGKGGNQAVAAARLGAQVAMIGWSARTRTAQRCARASRRKASIARGSRRARPHRRASR